MRVVLESIFVGLYLVILFRALLLFIRNKYILLFTLGFLKHFLSYFLGFQSYYCNNGYACNGILDKSKTYVASDKFLVVESILEGLWFLVVGLIIFSIVYQAYSFKFVKNEKTIPSVIIFLIGAFTHILAEIFKLHDYFCKNRCVVKKI